MKTTAAFRLRRNPCGKVQYAVLPDPKGRGVTVGVGRPDKLILDVLSMDEARKLAAALLWAVGVEVVRVTVAKVPKPKKGRGRQ